ncbi:hypothetical protein ACFS07_32580 [Undibacterium arcticum]
MIKTVTADPMPVIGFATMGDNIPVAFRGMELDAWTNSYGAVAAVFSDGRKLGVKPDEFEVIEWSDPARISIAMRKITSHIKKAIRICVAPYAV